MRWRNLDKLWQQVVDAAIVRSRCVGHDCRIEWVFHPVPPSDEHACSV